MARSTLGIFAMSMALATAGILAITMVAMSAERPFHTPRLVSDACDTQTMFEAYGNFADEDASFGVFTPADPTRLQSFFQRAGFPPDRASDFAEQVRYVALGKDRYHPGSTVTVGFFDGSRCLIRATSPTPFTLVAGVFGTPIPLAELFDEGEGEGDDATEGEPI